MGKRGIYIGGWLMKMGKRKGGKRDGKGGSEALKKTTS
jgi:hypothetical protein